MKSRYHQKTNIFILILLLACLFGSCTHRIRSLSEAMQEQLNTADIVFTTEEEELGLYRIDNEEIGKIQTNSIHRFSYSSGPGNLLIHSYLWDHAVGFINREGSEFIGYGFDGCDMVSFLDEGESIGYVTYKTLIEGGKKLEGDLVLVRSTGADSNEVIVILSINDEARDYDYCFLGTNIEYDGKLYYQDMLPTGEHAMWQLDMSTHELRTIFTTDLIMAPAISPTGEQIAFTKKDGIYVYEFQTANIEKIVDIRWASQFSQWNKYSYNFSKYVPIASWSPDGNQIVYSVSKKIPYSANGDYVPDENEIFVYDFTTKKETKIISGGYSPYWISD